LPPKTSLPYSQDTKNLTDKKELPLQYPLFIKSMYTTSGQPTRYTNFHK